MNGSKAFDMQPGGFAVRAISGHQLQHADSVASSQAARQLPVALITTSGCQFCGQVRHRLARHACIACMPPWAGLPPPNAFLDYDADCEVHARQERPTGWDMLLHGHA